MDELQQLLADLVAIDSVNPDLVPGAAGETRIANFIADWAHRNGLDATLQAAAPDRPNVIVTARGSGGGKSLMFNGHMDTVDVFNMAEPFAARVEDDRMFGRGAYDMKCGLAASLIAAKRVASANLRGDVHVACVADEEVASLGSQAIVRELHRWRPDAVIVTEPTELELVVAHKGFVWLDIETRGVAAHGSRPRLGVDAIAHMGRVLSELERLDLRLRASSPHPYLETGSLHASLVSGGTGWSSYPSSCKLSVEVRTLPSETVEVVTARAQSMLDGLRAMDSSFDATLKVVLARHPFEVNEDSDLVRALDACARDALGASPRRTGAPYWADAALFSSAGVPTVMFGPHGEGAHAAVEWVDLESVAKCADIYAATAKAMCA